MVTQIPAPTPETTVDYRNPPAILTDAIVRWVHDGEKQGIFKGLNAEQRLQQARHSLVQILPQIFKQGGQGDPACGPRCPACCIYVEDVGVLRIEVRRILDLVEQQGRLEEVTRRARARHERGKGACPLLSRDGRCTVYSERPLTCRRYHSFDKEACRRAHHAPDTILVPANGNAIAFGAAVAVLAAGEEKEVVDLFEALPPMAEARVRRAQKAMKHRSRPSATDWAAAASDQRITNR